VLAKQNEWQPWGDIGIRDLRYPAQSPDRDSVTDLRGTARIISTDDEYVITECDEPAAHGLGDILHTAGERRVSGRSVKKPNVAKLRASS
jgi:hypothetical protein